jgi:hypothetical protein
VFMLRLTALVLASGALACGGRATSAGAQNEDSQAGGAAGSFSGGGAPSCGTNDPTGVKYSGQLTLSYNPDVSAQFWVQGGFSGAPSQIEVFCSTGVVVGACCYTDLGIRGIALPIDIPTAGVLTVSDAGTTLTTLQPGNYLKSSEFERSLTWAPGDILELTTSGAEVEAFHASIATPLEFSGLSPEFSRSLDVPLSSDFVLSWTPQATSCTKVQFVLADGVSANIVCSVDDSAGMITVPAQLLAKVTSTSAPVALSRINSVFFRTAKAGVEVDAMFVRSATMIVRP